MKRKEFIKKSSTIVAGGMIIPIISCNSNPPLQEDAELVERAVRKNWAGNYQFQAKNLHEPHTVEQIQTLVKELNQQKALGSFHCFNNIADSPQNQISTKNLNKVVRIDEVSKSVTVESGMRYGELAPILEAQGFALHNLASLPHISVAGACSTATHGSGITNGNLATAVNALEMVTPDGKVLNLSKTEDPDRFNGAVAGLGALGIITKVGLDIEQTYQVRQDLFQELPLESLQNHFDEIMSSGYSVSLFTDWMDEKISQIWIKRKVYKSTADLDQNFFGAQAATKNLHPITRLSAENCTQQMGVAGAWYDRLPHFKMGFTPSSGKELQSEYFVAREHAVEAILALEKKKDLIHPQLMITEIRTIAADNIWMSTAYQRDSVAIHFTWKQNWKEVQKLLPMIEAELSPFEARPHWGKLFTLDPEILRSRYPRYHDFVNLAQELDPQGKFKNAYLDLNIY